MSGATGDDRSVPREGLAPDVVHDTPLGGDDPARGAAVGVERSPHGHAPAIEATRRLLVVGLVLLAVVPVLGTGFSTWLVEREASRATAQALAWAVANDADGLRSARLAELLGSGEHALDQRREVIDADGRVVATSGTRATGGAIVTTATATTADGRTMAVRVSESLRHVVLASLLAAVLSIAAAASVWLLVVARSVRDLRSTQGRLRKLHHIDALTGLLNRAGLARHLERRRTADASRPHGGGVLVIDLDRFRLINASLGPGRGDELLRDVAQRIHAVLRPRDAAARLGSDIFAVASDRLVSPAAAEALARNLLRAIESDMHIGQRGARLSAHVGIALVDAQASKADELLARAEAALRAAKSGGGALPYRVFDESMLAEMVGRAELDMALRQAVETHGFHLVYQPILESDGRTIHAVEALLRWHPQGRPPVPPGRFIPLLEEAGLIAPVGAWVLREACRRAQSWVAHGAPPFMLSVNVSPLQLAEADFVTQVLATLDATGWPAQRLQFEVTEGVLLDPAPQLLATLDRLVDAGVSLALDDFGMGYSSLAYLKRFRLHTIKIDRMFVIDVPTVAKDTAIVRAMVELAHALGLHVTAEGIETPQQWTALSRLGCDSLQGFLFDRPLDAAPMLERLRAQGSSAQAQAMQGDWSTTLAHQLDAELSGKGDD